MKCKKMNGWRNCFESHPVRGGWIEMPDDITDEMIAASPTPCGVGGLKFLLLRIPDKSAESHPVRGGWIEMTSTGKIIGRYKSHPVRGGWIEIVAGDRAQDRPEVPPRAGWVD